MLDDYEEPMADQFDVENDLICKEMVYEAKFNDCGYHRLRERLAHKGYTLADNKHAFACRD